MIRRGETQRQMKVLESLDDVPNFETEAQEADFWATHELGESILEAMGPLDDVLPRPGDGLDDQRR